MQYKNHKQYRYKGYDYSQVGFYFITICTKNREIFFGDVIGKYHEKFIEDAEVKLSVIEKIAGKYWQELPTHFPFIKLDKFVVMPNHIHGIIQINRRRNAPRRVPTGIQPLIKNSLSSIINHYKGSVKKYCNKNNFKYFTWQPRFHDRIIRNENELNRIRQYIIDNPVNWAIDRNNLENLYM